MFSRRVIRVVVVWVMRAEMDLMLFVSIGWLLGWDGEKGGKGEWGGGERSGTCFGVLKKCVARNGVRQREIDNTCFTNVEGVPRGFAKNLAAGFWIERAYR